MKNINTSRLTFYQRYQRLIEVLRDLASTLDLDTLLKKIILVAAEVSNAEAASILLYDETANELYFQTATNLAETVMRGLMVPVQGSLAGWVIQNREPLMVGDVHQDPRYFGKVEKDTQYATHSLMAIPLLHKDKILGVLEVLNKKEGTFSADDLELQMVLAAQAAVAIENTRLFQQSDLISELVHELRTPLGSLNTAAYLLQRPELPGEQRDRLAKMIAAESKRLTELSTSYLDYARLESGRAPFHFSTFNLPLLVEECREHMLARAEEQGITLRFNPEAMLVEIEGDRDKLKQVVLNLLSNAIKYNRPQGSVTMQIRVCPQEVCLLVQDTGVGIPPDALPHLFQKFYRTKEAEKLALGTGLGLSICQSIIRSHRGRIEVQSHVGQGTEFAVFLPFRQSA